MTICINIDTFSNIVNFMTIDNFLSNVICLIKYWQFDNSKYYLVLTLFFNFLFIDLLTLVTCVLAILTYFWTKFFFFKIEHFWNNLSDTTDYNNHICFTCNLIKYWQFFFNQSQLCHFYSQLNNDKFRSVLLYVYKSKSSVRLYWSLDYIFVALKKN